MSPGPSRRAGVALLVALVTVALSVAVLAAVFTWTTIALRSGRAAVEWSRAKAETETAVAQGMGDLSLFPEPAVRLADSVWLYPLPGRAPGAAMPLELLVRWQGPSGPDTLSGGRPAARRWRLAPAF